MDNSNAVGCDEYCKTVTHYSESSVEDLFLKLILLLLAFICKPFFGTAINKMITARHSFTVLILLILSHSPLKTGLQTMAHRVELAYCWFLKIKFYWNTGISICLRIIYIQATTAGLSNCNDGRMAHKYKIFTIWPFKHKIVNPCTRRQLVILVM